MVSIEEYNKRRYYVNKVLKEPKKDICNDEEWNAGNNIDKAISILKGKYKEDKEGNLIEIEI